MRTTAFANTYFQLCGGINEEDDCSATFFFFLSLLSSPTCPFRIGCLLTQLSPPLVTACLSHAFQGMRELRTFFRTKPLGGYAVCPSQMCMPGKDMLHVLCIMSASAVYLEPEEELARGFAHSLHFFYRRVVRNTWCSGASLGPPH